VDTPILLEIRDLTVQRDGRCLLSDVSLTVPRGSAHLLVGPNGAGKSTLLTAVLGRLEFTGTIRFHWRGSGDIGYVPQSFVADPTLPVTVREFLTLGHQRRPICLGIGRAQRHRVEEVLTRVGLSGFSPRLLSALSGGELQRVLLANAIDPLPELLVLDEPASGLDETAVGRFEDVLSDLKRSAQTTIFMVSHDLGQVRRLADRVTLLDRRVRRTGSPAQILMHDLAGSFAPTADAVEP
jgi:zinc transport system ATP-binding protein